MKDDKPAPTASAGAPSDKPWAKAHASSSASAERKGPAMVGKPVGVGVSIEPKKPLPLQQRPAARGKSLGTSLRTKEGDLDMSIAFTGIVCLIARFVMAFWLFFLSGEEDLGFVGWFSYLGAFVASAAGVFGMLRHGALPLGCECIPACAGAQAGCFTCPCVPWSLSVWGIIGIFIGSAAIGAGTLNVSAGLFVVDILGALMLGTFGCWWLWLLRQQEGRACCIPLTAVQPQRPDAETLASPLARRAAMSPDQGAAVEGA